MKKAITFLPFQAKWGTGIQVLVLSLVAILPSLAYSQNADVRQEIGDLSAIDWKNVPAFEAAIAQEDARIDGYLAAPGLSSEDRALYLSYQRMLDLVLSNAQANKPLDEAVYDSYEQVLKESLVDPDLKPAPQGLLITFVPGLIEVLTVAPEADASGQ